MEIRLKPKIGRPKSDDPLNEIESIPITSAMKAKIRQLKNRGLGINDMTRDFLCEVIRQAEQGKIEGFDSAS